MVLNPMRVFAGSFRGQVLWSNGEYVSPNAVRRGMRDRRGAGYEAKTAAKAKRKAHVERWHLHGPDELDIRQMQ